MLLIIFSTFSLWLRRARGSALGISWVLRTRRASSQPRSVCTPSPPLLWEMIRPPRLCLCVPRSNHMKSIEPVMNPSWIRHESVIFLRSPIPFVCLWPLHDAARVQIVQYVSVLTRYCFHIFHCMSPRLLSPLFYSVVFETHDTGNHWQAWSEWWSWMASSATEQRERTSLTRQAPLSQTTRSTAEFAPTTSAKLSLLGPECERSYAFGCIMMYICNALCRHCKTLQDIASPICTKRLVQATRDHPRTWHQETRCSSQAPPVQRCCCQRTRRPTSLCLPQARALHPCVPTWGLVLDQKCFVATLCHMLWHVIACCSSSLEPLSIHLMLHSVHVCKLLIATAEVAFPRQGRCCRRRRTQVQGYCLALHGSLGLCCVCCAYTYVSLSKTWPPVMLWTHDFPQSTQS